jgi:dimethylhistidine N-methyltransferase
MQGRHPVTETETVVSTRSPTFLQQHHIDDRRLAEEAAAGLRARPAHVSPKFFYDALGSRLFDAITELEEYYPTRTEAAIFAASGAAIGDAALGLTGPSPVLVDLGAGNCAKAARLFAQLRPRRYVAVDISVDFLRESLLHLQREHAAMDLVGIGMDFSTRLELPAAVADGPTLVFYPGSSIGNFAPDQALRLLRDARHAGQGGGLLIGVDLVKDKRVLDAAYDDALGVTAAFNRNLLNHVNRLLGANFEVRQWRHVAFFDEAAGRIEMHLEARRATTVCWPGSERTFVAGERIHTENSYKWTRAGFATLLGQAGFRDVRCWTDPREWFAVFLAAA